MDDAQFEARNILDPLFHLGKRRTRLRLARRHILALRIIDHDDGHVAEIFPVFLNCRGIGKRDENGRQRQEAPQAAARTAPEADRQQDKCQAGRGRQERPGQERRELQAKGADAHCPSLSKIAGTWTWSDL